MTEKSAHSVAVSFVGMFHVQIRFISTCFATDDELIPFDGDQILLGHRFDFSAAGDADSFPSDRGGHGDGRVSARLSTAGGNA